MSITAVATGRAVVCDDDALVRSVIRQLLDDSLVSVVGEADSPAGALETIDETGADILILDLALRGGSGERLLQEVAAERPDLRVVVYSSYAADHAQLIAAGATAVVEKPDFARLHDAVDEVIRELGLPVQRRRPSPCEVVDLPAPTAVSLSGFEPWASFLHAAERLRAGDAVLCADILPAITMRDVWDDVFATDHRVALGRAMVAERRSSDRVSVSPEGRPVQLLVGGHPEAPTSVFKRLVARWAREVDMGTPVGAVGLVRTSDDPHDRLRVVVTSVATERSAPLRLV
ncbi:MAG: response regulator transcription factor [Acidimicrobiales bacterium]|nr:response regulator transcription factor [Acidimicrobiales bacterium]